MKPSDGLRYDHDVLRAKLALLETYLPCGHACGCTLSRLADSLASCLRSHTEREERLLSARAWRHGAPTGASLQRLHDEHENHRTRLAILHELLVQPGPAADAQVAAQASSLVRDLREHMAKEERLFPLMDQEPGEEEARMTAAAEDQAVPWLDLA